MISHPANHPTTCYLVHGIEPLQKNKYISNIKEIAQKNGYAECESMKFRAPFNWDPLLETCNNLSLFSQKKIIEIEILTEKLSKQDSSSLLQFLQTKPKDILILLHANKLNQNTLNSSLISYIRKFGKVYFAKNIPLTQWPHWIQQQLEQVGFKAEPELINYLVNCYEGNTLALSQCIQKIQAVISPGSLSLKQIKPFLNDNPHFSIFELVASALNSDCKRTVSLFYHLKKEGIEPTLLLWGIAREARILLQLSTALQSGEKKLHNIAINYGVWQSQINNIQRALDRMNIPYLKKLMCLAKTADTMIKGVHNGDIWSYLLALYLMLAGYSTL